MIPKSAARPGLDLTDHKAQFDSIGRIDDDMDMTWHDNVAQESKPVSRPRLVDFLQHNPYLSFSSQQPETTIAGEIDRADGP